MAYTTTLVSARFADFKIIDKTSFGSLTFLLSFCAFSVLAPPLKQLQHCCMATRSSATRAMSRTHKDSHLPDVYSLMDQLYEANSKVKPHLTPCPLISSHSWNFQNSPVSSTALSHACFSNTTKDALTLCTDRRWIRPVMTNLWYYILLIVSCAPRTGSGGTVGIVCFDVALSSQEHSAFINGLGSLSVCYSHLSIHHKHSL